MAAPTYDTIEFNKFECSKAMRNKHGGFAVYTHFPGQRENITFQAWREEDGDEKPYAPYGYSEPYGASTGESTGDVSRKTVEWTLRAQSAIQFFRDLDEFNIKNIAAHSTEWFGRPQSEEQVRAKYLPTIVQDRSTHVHDPNAPAIASIRTKLHTQGKFKANLYRHFVDAEDNPRYAAATYKDIGKNSESVPIVELNGYWFVSSQCGMGLTTASALIYPHASPQESFMFNFGNTTQPVAGVAEPETAEERPPSPEPMATHSAVGDTVFVPSEEASLPPV